MSQNKVPCSSEVSGWSPEKLADFLRKRNLQGCDRIVLQNRITGERFMNLTNNDLDRFPKTYCPLISKLSADIRKQKSGKRFFAFAQSKQPQPVEFEAEDCGWGRDEFEDSDDYEDPEKDVEEEDVSDYEEPCDEPRPGQNQARLWTPDPDSDLDYEPPPSEPDDLGPKLPLAPLADGDYIDSHMKSRGPPPALCPRPPPTGSRRDASPRPKPTGKFPPQPPPILRVNKPGRDPGSSRSPNRGRLINAAEKPPQTWSRPQQDSPESHKPPIFPPTPVSVSRSNSGARPPHSRPQQDSPESHKPPIFPPTPVSVSRSNSGARPPHRFDAPREKSFPGDDLKRNTFPLHNKSGLPPARHTQEALSGHTGSTFSLPPVLPSAHKPFSGGSPAPERSTFRSPPSSQDLDSLWYVGKVTRADAEASLKRLGKDGAYVVRDSSRRSTVQPYTLMVLYQNKVFNIQIQIHDHQYLLGTGLKVQESFPSVRGMVDHFSQNPLLLVDTKNRSSGQHNECLLSEPAGPYMGQH